jgi:hypothetical protein
VDQKGLLPLHSPRPITNESSNLGGQQGEPKDDGEGRYDVSLSLKLGEKARVTQEIISKRGVARKTRPALEVRVEATGFLLNTVHFQSSE